VSVSWGNFADHESWACRADFSRRRAALALSCVALRVCVHVAHLCAHVRTIERQDLDISCNKLWELSPRDRGLVSSPGISAVYPTRFSPLSIARSLKACRTKVYVAISVHAWRQHHAYASVVRSRHALYETGSAKMRGKNNQTRSTAINYTAHRSNTEKEKNERSLIGV